MNELKKPSAETIAFMNEFHRQLVIGEYAAMYWLWEYQVATAWLRTSYPSFDGHKYICNPSKAHPHYAIYKEWEAHKASGDVGLGHYCVMEIDVDLGLATLNPKWKVDSVYEIHKTSKHPANCKPKLKLIDWSSVPVGTLTNYGVVLVANNAVVTVFGGLNIRDVYQSAWSQLRLLPATMWTALQDGQDTPVAKGLVIEYRYCQDAYYPSAVTQYGFMLHINAYRVISLAEGYTDDPAKVGGV